MPSSKVKAPKNSKKDTKAVAAPANPSKPVKKSSSKFAKPSKASRPAPVVAPPETASEDGEEEDSDEKGVEDEGEWVDEDEVDEGESSDDTSDGVDEEGLKRLLEALGKDGLDDFDQAQLASYREAGSDEDEDEDEAEAKAVSGSEGEGTESDDASDKEDDVEAESSKMAIEGDVDEGDEEEGEGEEAIPLDEVEDSVDEDAVPRRKVEIDNHVALERIRATIALDSSLPWTETLVVSYPEKIEVDVNDDLTRELAFYKQALHGANAARSLAAVHKLPFTRPTDYFAEMVKSDSHMERIRQRLLDEKASIKKSEDARREREGKKFGKQVQVEKLKERERSKKEMEERIKGLKRKRKDMLETPDANGTGGDDDFDVRVEEALSDKPRPEKRSKISREGRNNKYGFGGKVGRHSKSNTRESTDDFSGRRSGRSRRGGGGRGGGRGGFGGGGKGRGKPSRPGKSKRQAGRS